MRLVSVYEYPGAAAFLYRLLEERPAIANISHRKMPTLVEHETFVASIPYYAWEIIEVAGKPVGAIYLTRRDEIGVAVLKEYGNRGYATDAVTQLIDQYPRPRYLANIAPENVRSHHLFRNLGFDLIQHTYELRTGDADAHH